MKIISNFTLSLLAAVSFILPLSANAGGGGLGDPIPCLDGTFIYYGQSCKNEYYEIASCPIKQVSTVKKIVFHVRKSKVNNESRLFTKVEGDFPLHKEFPGSFPNPYVFGFTEQVGPTLFEIDAKEHTHYPVGHKYRTEAALYMNLNKDSKTAHIYGKINGIDVNQSVNCKLSVTSKI
ncbi:MAG: hypothetical protein V4736_14945 [Bdellovibrionota bacterium]